MSSRMLESVVSDNEYRQRVRRYKPTSFLPLIAATAARYREQQEWLNSPYRKYMPWALADAARVSRPTVPSSTGRTLQTRTCRS